MLAPAWSWKHYWWHTLFGWGVGNILSAVKTGYQGARQWYGTKGGLIDGEISGLAYPTAEPFTMNDYVSFIAEFGFIYDAALGASGDWRSAGWSQLEPAHVVSADSDDISVRAVRGICILRFAVVGIGQVDTGPGY